MSVGLGLLALALASSSAQAAQLHAFSAAFGEPGSGAGGLGLAFPRLSAGGKPETAGSGVAVDEETGDVYVADTGNHRVSEFDPSKPEGERFLRAFGADVGGPGIDVCEATCVAGTPGDQPGELEAPTFIAVDNDPASASHGDVYVFDEGDGLVTKFDAEGALVASWSTGGQLGALPTLATGTGKLSAGSEKVTGLPPGEFLVGETVSGEGIPPGASIVAAPAEEPGTIFLDAGATITASGVALDAGLPSFAGMDGIAVDSDGNLWLQVRGVVVSLEGSVVASRSWHSEADQPTGIGLDGAGDVYLSNGFPWGPIEKFTAAGTPLGALFGQEGNFFTGLAVDRADGDLYADLEGEQIATVSAACVPTPGQGRCAPTEVFGEGKLTKAAGLAVDSADAGVYVAETAAEQIFSFPITLEATVGAATGIGGSLATVHGRVAPEATPVTSCAFQYGTTTGYGDEVPCLDASGEVVGTAAQPISAPSELHADLTGLVGGATYHYRLRVGNSAADFLSSGDEQLTTVPLATIDSAGASEVTESSATLGALINPHGVAGTEYHFEWGPCGSAATCSTSAYPEVGPVVRLAPGTAPVAVSEAIGGLSAGTTYHLRVVVADANGTVTSPEAVFVFSPAAEAASACANEALRGENGSTGLPDCRAYELVTPVQKNGALIGALLFNKIPPALADDGSRVIAPSIQCFSGSPSCVATRVSEGEPFQFTRTEAGWQTSPLALPASSFATSSLWRFDANTGTVLYSAPRPPGGEDAWYTRAEGGAVTDHGPLWEGGLALHSLRGLEPEPTVTSADFSHILYESQEPLWSFDAGDERAQGVYEYASAGASAPLLVAVSGGPGSDDLIGLCGADVAGRGAVGALSADGRTAYFQVKHCPQRGTGANSGREVPVEELFARVDGEAADARTVAISEPAQLSQEDPACTSAECLANTSDTQRFRDAHFEAASADGGRVYFTSTQQLTDEASQDPRAGDSAFAGCSETTGRGGCNLYLFEGAGQQPLTGAHLVDASAGDSSGLGPEVQGTLAVSGDGSHAYFVAEGVLSEERNEQGERAAEGANNLYLYERDTAHPQGHTVFIGRLSGADSEEWLKGLGIANVTPDGRYLVFQSHRGLTPDARAEGPAQIYRYDAETGRLERISFGARGFDDDGNAAGPGADASIAGAIKTILLQVSPIGLDPTMSGDGSRVFFQSPVALTPGALAEVRAGQGADLAQNIYEWEEPGQGSCTAGETRGCVSLISGGEDTSERSTLLGASVELLGSDTSGENVFFATADQLVPADTDSQRDYYDARVGGGFAPAAAVVPCQGDACKGAGTEAGAESSPATAGMVGPEEGPRHLIKPKRHKKHHKQKKHHKKKGGHHKKGHHKKGHHGNGHPRASRHHGGKK
jgi:DNA-binding beta-propeller fold protein YncE